MTSPARYSPSVERIGPDEAETVDALCETFEAIQQTTARDYGHAVRSVHAKAHGVLEGVLTVDDGLPPELAQGLFATPGEHKVYMRISTNAGDILPDSVSLPRGLAIKVLDVEGERLPDAEGATQDFILVNSPVFQARTVQDFLGALKLLARTTDRAEGAKVALSSFLRGVHSALKAVGVESPRIASGIASLGGAPNVNPLGETYYSVTPFRYGDYIAKFSVAPITPALTELTGHRVDASGHPDALRKAIREEMQEAEGVWEFRVQLARDLDRQPIEDPTVEWSEDEAPFKRVGEIVARPQDSWGQADLIDEKMRFSVWTEIAAHRPLGNVNRARKAAYRHSSEFRERFNACPIHEPGALNGSVVNGSAQGETLMERTIIGSFATRRDAELAIEHLVQDHGVERTDVFVQPQGSANSAGTQAAGADLENSHYGAEPELNGAVEVSVDCHGALPQVVESVLRESGAQELRSR